MSKHLSTPRTRACVASIVIAMTLVVGACSSSSKSSSTTTTTAGGKNFHVTVPQGQVSLSLTGSLPPNWPSGFPVAPDAKPAGSGSLGGQEKTTMVAVYTTSQAPDQTFSFYAENEKLNASNQRVVGVGSRYVATMRLSGTFAGSLAVLGKPDDTYIVVVLDTAGTASSTTAPAPPTT